MNIKELLLQAEINATEEARASREVLINIVTKSVLAEEQMWNCFFNSTDTFEEIPPKIAKFINDVVDALVRENAIRGC